MTTTTESITLTAEHLKALRNADDISFHHDTNLAVPTFVSATKRIKGTDGFGDRDLQVTIPADVAFTIYGDNGTSGRLIPRVAFTSLLSAKFSPEWATAAKLLKAGDRLVLRWTRSNVRAGGNPSNFQLHTFGLEVVRKTKTAGTFDRLVFMLVSHVEVADSGFTLEF